MDGFRYPVTVHLHGTLAANATGAFQVPVGLKLVEISACGSNTNDGKLTVGTSADADGILTSGAIGDGSTPAVFGPAEFDGALCDQKAGAALANDTIFTWTLDYDGAAGTAAANVMIVFTFLEG